ncbi:MAG: hypothetical protein ACJ8CR_18735 [Roseiflexaceae bacterium]
MSDGHETAETQPDVGAILEALRADVRAQRLARGRAEPSPAERDLQRALDEIELYRVISAHWPLLGTTLPQRVVALCNKLVRRYLRWYINPIVEQQNAYNDAVARTLRLLAEAYAELGEQTDDRRPTTDDRSQFNTLMSLVRARGAIEPPARLPDLDLYIVAPQLHLREQVNAHWPLAGATLPQRVIALLNKLVRRYLRWYINPIVEQQNAANAAFTIALMRLIALDAERRAEVAALRAKGKR